MSPGNECSAAQLSHSALVYDSDQQLLDVAVPFLRDGIASGDATLLCVSDRGRPLILDALGDVSGVTVVPPWVGTGAFSTLRQNHRLVSDHPPTEGGQVRILGEVPSPADTIPWGGWVRYETAVNQLYASLPVVLLCAYDRRAIPEAVLDDVNHTHPTLSETSDGTVESSEFTTPATFLDELSQRDLDGIESEAPAFELVDQLPGTTRRSVATLAENTELERPQIDALALAVGEVVTNAIVHGRPPVVVRAWAPSNRVVVSVVDHGDGPEDPFIGMLPVPAAAGGLGLHVVYQTCSLVTMSRTDEEFTVHLTMHLPAD